MGGAGMSNFRRRLLMAAAAMGRYFAAWFRTSGWFRNEPW